MQEIIIIENRFRIFIGIVICIIFAIPVFFYIEIFANPIIENFSNLQANEIFIFGSSVFLAVIGLFILCISILFMTFKLLLPPKIYVSERGIKICSKKDLIEWETIVNIKYLSIKNFGKKFIWIWLTIIPTLGFAGILQAIRCLILFQIETDGLIVIQKSNNKNIILPIDESFVNGEEKVIDILKKYWGNNNK